MRKDSAQELRVVVQRREAVADDIVAITLARVDGRPFPAWSPGSHIDVVLGQSEEPFTRQYSLCGDPDDRDHWRVAVLRQAEGRGGSVLAHELAEGDELAVKGPRNHFEMAAAPRYEFVAGGIGITPILAMVRHASSSGHPWKLHYLARVRSRFAFLDELDQLPGGEVITYCSDEGSMFDMARDLVDVAPDSGVYTCGPAGLLDALVEYAGTSAWVLNFERFVPGERDPDEADREFTIVLGEDGPELTVPRGVSCLQILRDNGVKMEWSCKEGVCGTCETDILEGLPDHRDSVLTPDERASNETMMVCVSRALGDRIVLDL